MSVHDALESLVRDARERLSRTQEGKTVVTVQVSHCSISVGAGEVAAALAAALPDDASMVTAGCDGACFDAPQVLVTTASGERHRYVRVSPESARDIAAQVASGTLSESAQTNGFHSGQHRITLDGCGELDCEVIDSYLDHGGYSGLAKALAMTPDELIEEVKESGLRGRGGAYFPAALKWQGARSVKVEPRYLVVNSEEGEPGVFKDRHLMEGVPHRLLEGAIIAAYASGVAQAYIYINAEANLSADRMQMAVAQAYEKGLLGEDILSSGYSLEVEIMRGAGGYVCGEETTLLNTMEGYRREPRLRPPFPTEQGLWAKPTVINNAETLCSLPYILSNGAKAYASVGSEDATGT
ncbi:MAG: NADH-quinone oxidoreductase subunit F, partial [Chloroflexi bacterium]|nr:NADH-quinone oxidoreductase subunit F [Chloroflexota bacterium]